MSIDQLLDLPPFELMEPEKQAALLPALNEAFAWHYKQCLPYRKYIKTNNLFPSSFTKIEDFPFLPIQIFKELILSSVPKTKILTSILSSSTSSNLPSTVVLDQITMQRQQKALINILMSFLGKERRHFLIIDALTTSKRQKTFTPSRASAIRGFALFSKSIHFLLNDQLEFDIQAWNEALKSVPPKGKICFMGFTWLIYQWYLAIKHDEKIVRHLKQALQKLHLDIYLLHIGGWKKMKDQNVSKRQFNQELSELFGIPQGNIIDIYGMTEQLGTVYMDCEYGHKHVPLYSEIIIRNPFDCSVQPINTQGLIQLLSPIPHSYPGISLLTEDIGKIVGIDSCACGRKGKIFEFVSRVEKAPVKGCGDTL